MPRKRCLGGCGTFITRGSYCKACHPYNSRAWRATSAYVIRRDGGICQRCHKPGANTAGHIVARAYGGSNDPSNLQAEHKACNSRARGG